LGNPADCGKAFEKVLAQVTIYSGNYRLNPGGITKSSSLGQAVGGCLFPLSGLGIKKTQEHRAQGFKLSGPLFFQGLNCHSHPVEFEPS